MRTLTTAGTVQLDSRSQSGLARGARGALKRLFDIGVSATLLLMLVPVIALLALLIKCQDRGPAFYRRRVVGPKGEFDAFKLRTMRVDADAVLRNNASLRREFEINFKLKNDPRVTPLGAALRKTSLDELPQLWNVLIGQMSLVGPRPLILDEHAHVNGWKERRLTLKPGITGLWQVLGRDEIPFEDMVKLDFLYVTNWSIVNDLRLILRTPSVLAGARAHGSR